MMSEHIHKYYICHTKQSVPQLRRGEPMDPEVSIDQNLIGSASKSIETMAIV
jgi:hypothetical protein